MNKRRQHAYSTETEAPNPAPEPSYAERARTMINLSQIGVLLGNAETVPKDDLAAARAAYLTRHENASYYVDFADFSFWRLHPVDLYFVGGFGVMGWVEVSEFEQALPDPLAEAALGILQHMNNDHAPALIEIALHEKGVSATEVKMTAVDRLGFHLRLKTPERTQSVRIGFPDEVRSPDDCRAAFVAMVQRARSEAGPGTI